MTGGLGNDTLNGGDGNDTLNGGLGQDSVTGVRATIGSPMLVTAGNVDTSMPGQAATRWSSVESSRATTWCGSICPHRPTRWSRSAAWLMPHADQLREPRLPGARQFRERSPRQRRRQ